MSNVQNTGFMPNNMINDLNRTNGSGRMVLPGAPNPDQTFGLQQMQRDGEFGALDPQDSARRAENLTTDENRGKRLGFTIAGAAAMLGAALTAGVCALLGALTLPVIIGAAAVGAIGLGCVLIGQIKFAPTNVEHMQNAGKSAVVSIRDNNVNHRLVAEQGKKITKSDKFNEELSKTKPVTQKEIDRVNNNIAKNFIKA